MAKLFRAACLAALSGLSLAACKAVPTSTQTSALISGAVTLAQIAASKNTTAANLLNKGAAICGQQSSVVGQLVEGSAIAALNAEGVPVSVTGQLAGAVADTCAAIGTQLVPGPAPAGQAVVPAAIVPTTPLPPVSS
jgi:hypothetical protein